ncbi:helix-turn-helix transcriptional regulator [Actinosynnema sp. CS-041913]|uniref:helix-turn-helix transcriptional regulator n=1 Tax=Actinosynnema sp. CS-041913 TaxID=3239917 RepID=UPI003D8ABF3F
MDLSPLPDPSDFLTVTEFCAKLRISKDTFYKWRQIPGAAPVAHKLPNGSLRISATDFNAWLTTLRSEAA